MAHAFAQTVLRQVPAALGLAPGTHGSATRFGTAGYARQAVVHILTERHHYQGTLCVPAGKKRVSDVLCDGKPFLNLTEVSTDGGAPEEFLAINKTAILSLRILRDGAQTLAMRAV